MSKSRFNVKVDKGVGQVEIDEEELPQSQMDRPLSESHSPRHAEIAALKEWLKEYPDGHKKKPSVVSHKAIARQAASLSYPANGFVCGVGLVDTDDEEELSAPKAKHTARDNVTVHNAAKSNKAVSMPENLKSKRKYPPNVFDGVREAKSAKKKETSSAKKARFK
jgi:hypothetical protein